MVEIILFIFLFIIFAFLSLKLRVEILEEENKKIEKNGIVVKTKVYIFKFIKVFEITFSNTGFKYLKFKREHKYKIEKLDFFKLLLNSDALKILSVKNYKVLNLKIKELDLKVKVGLMENIVTTFFVTVISSLISIFLSTKISVFNKEKIYYKVDPVFDEFYFDIDIKLRFEVYAFSIYKFLIFNRKYINDFILLLREISFNSASNSIDSNIKNDGDLSNKNNTQTKLKESSI